MGIVSIVDVHQDGLSRYLNYGCGDGFPLWIIPARYLNQLSTPDNDVRCKNWKYTLLLDPAVAGTWLAFFNNENDVRDAFLKVWDILAGLSHGLYLMHHRRNTMFVLPNKLGGSSVLLLLITPWTVMGTDIPYFFHLMSECIEQLFSVIESR